MENNKQKIIVPIPWFRINSQGYVVLSKTWKSTLKKNGIKKIQSIFSKHDNQVFVITIPKVSDNHLIYKIAEDSDVYNGGIQDIPRIKLDFYKIRELLSIFDNEIIIDNNQNFDCGLDIINGIKCMYKDKKSKKHQSIYSLNPLLKKMSIKCAKRVSWQKLTIDPKYLLIDNKQCLTLDVELINVCEFEHSSEEFANSKINNQFNVKTTWNL